MKKQTKVLLAAALFTLGASFSSMAARKDGTWVHNEEGWQYADKDGEYVSEAWCVSYGKEYWINEDEVLGSSEWVEDTDSNYLYYAQSDGSKTINAWKYLYASTDDDEDEDQNWYYFNAKGRMVTGKQTIGDTIYYFDKDGKLLTGWINKTDEKEPVAVDEKGENLATTAVVYANEDGAVIVDSWLHVFPWTADQDECYEGEHEKYYYAGSKGKITTGKKDVDGLTYFFNADTGIMMSGWVVKTQADVYTNANADADLTNAKEVYLTNDTGYASKNRWVEHKTPAKTGDKYFWYYFDKTGKAFIASPTNADPVIKKAKFVSGENESQPITADAPVAVEMRKINGVEYYFNNKGEMINGLVYFATNSNATFNLMSLDGGAKQTGKVTLTDENENDYTFMFADKAANGTPKYAAVTGNYNGYCYKNGQLMTSDDKNSYRLVETSVGKFIVDYAGAIQKKTNKDYLENGYAYKFNTTAKDNKKYAITDTVVKNN